MLREKLSARKEDFSAKTRCLNQISRARRSRNRHLGPVVGTGQEGFFILQHRNVGRSLAICASCLLASAASPSLPLADGDGRACSISASLMLRHAKGDDVLIYLFAPSPFRKPPSRRAYDPSVKFFILRCWGIWRHCGSCSNEASSPLTWRSTANGLPPLGVSGGSARNGAPSIRRAA